MSTPDPPSILASPSGAQLTPGNTLFTPSNTTGETLPPSPSQPVDLVDLHDPLASPSFQTLQPAEEHHADDGAPMIEMQPPVVQYVQPPAGTATQRKNNPSYGAGIASKRVADSSAYATQKKPKSETTGFFSGLLAQTAPIDKLPSLPPPFRIAVVGAAKSGKTQIIQRFLTGMYERNYIKTNKIEIGLKLLQTPSLGHSYHMEIWDIPSTSTEGGGMDELLKDKYLAQMDGAIIVTDSTDLKSFQSIRKWMEVFEELQYQRLSDNLQVLGTSLEDDPSLLRHSLPGSDGRPLVVSTFPVMLFANKNDSEKCTLSEQDILESAAHFKCSYGVLGSALLNKPLSVRNLSSAINNINNPGIQHLSGLLTKMSQLNGGVDGCIDQMFQLLLSELLRFQHLRSVTTLSTAGKNLGPQGVSILKPEQTTALGTVLSGTQGIESSLHSNAQHGTASRKFHATTGAPLPASLQSLRQRGSVRSTTSSAFSFDLGANATASPVKQLPKSALAAAQQRQAEDAAAAVKQREQEDEDDEEEEDEEETEEDEDEEESSESEEDEEEEEDEDDDEEEEEEGEKASPKAAAPAPAPAQPGSRAASASKHSVAAVEAAAPPSRGQSASRHSAVAAAAEPEPEPEPEQEQAVFEQEAEAEAEVAAEEPPQEEEQPAAAAEEAAVQEEAAPEAEAEAESEQAAEEPAAEAQPAAEETPPAEEAQPEEEQAAVEEEAASAEEEAPVAEEEQPAAEEEQPVVEEEAGQEEEEQHQDQPPAEGEEEAPPAEEEQPVEAEAEAEEQPAGEEEPAEAAAAEAEEVAADEVEQPAVAGEEEPVAAEEVEEEVLEEEVQQEEQGEQQPE